MPLDCGILSFLLQINKPQGGDKLKEERKELIQVPQPDASNRLRVEQEVVPVGHPTLKWVAFIIFNKILLQAFIY